MKRKTKWQQQLMGWLRMVISLLIILTGILVGALRLLLPQVANYQDWMRKQVEVALDAKVRFDGLEVRLAGLTPELRLTNLNIQLLKADKHSPPVHIGKLRLHFDLLGSLIDGRPKLAGIAIHGARIVLRFVPGQGLTLAGLATDSVAPAYFPLDLLLSQGPLLLANSSVRLERPDAQPLDIHPVTVRLIPGKDRLQVQLNAHLGVNGSLYFDAHATVATLGQSITAMLWRRVHLKVRNVQLNPILISWLSPNWNLGGILDAELWGRWTETQKSIVGQMALQDLRLGTVFRLAVQRITTTVGLQRDAQGAWNGRLSNLAWIQAGKYYSGAELDLTWPTTGANPQLKLALADTQLQDLVANVAAFPLPKQIRAALVSLAPQGAIQNLRLEATIPLTNEPMQWHLSGRISGFANTPWNKIPGVKNLNLDLLASSSGGHMQVASEALEIHAPRIFRAPLPALRLGGKLTWTIKPNGNIQITSRVLNLENQDFGLQSRLQLQIPSGTAPITMDLQSKFTKGNLAAAHHYLPVGVMKKPLIDWLDQALVAGRITSGEVLLRGPVAEFPFHNQEGRFEAPLHLENVTLKFQKRWPPLKQAVGTIRFLGPGLTMDLQQGRLLDSKVTAAHAEVVDIKPASHMPIVGHASGPFSDVLRILRGPLAKQQGRYVQGMAVEGDSSAKVKIEIPLESWATIRIDGRLNWQDAKLRMDEWGLALDGITGSLRFTDHGLFAQNIQAQLAGEPLTLSVDTIKAAKNGHSVTNLDIQIPLNQASLTAILPTWPWELLDGSAPGNLRLTIDHEKGTKQDKALDYRLESNLQGLAVNLPEPLGKTQITSRSLMVTGAIPPNVAHQIKIDYGKLRAALRMGAGDTPRMVAGEIINDANITPDPYRSGLRIGGRVQRLDVLGWLALYDHYETQIHNYLKQQKSTLRTQANLEIGTLGLPGEPLRNIKVALVQLKDAWQAKLMSPTAAGEIRIPNNPRRYPIRAHLTHLRLVLPEENTAMTINPILQGLKRYSVLPNPQRASGLDLHIDDLRLGTQSFGHFLIKSRPKPTGLNISQLSLNGPLFTITGHGSWTGTTEIQETRLHIKGQSPNLGQALRGMGFKSALQRAHMQMQVDLHCPTSIYGLTLENLNGTLKFKLGQGRIADVSPGVGRLFGLLSLEAIQRRLSLDFSDLFRKGLAFDSFDGTFKLKDGNATTSRIKITGPAADITISGRTGLAAQDYDQTVTVTPALSSTLPIAGAIVGGPIGAAAMFLAGQVVGDQVNKLISICYKLTGPWKTPEFTQIATEDGWSLTDLLVPDKSSTSTPAFEH